MMQNNPELKEDVESFRRISELTGSVRFEELPDPIWQAYSASLYRKTESALGWILLSVGAALILGFGVWGWFNEFFLNSAEPLLLRISVGALFGGAIILGISKLRETLFAHKRERYRKVQK